MLSDAELTAKKAYAGWRSKAEIVPQVEGVDLPEFKNERYAKPWTPTDEDEYKAPTPPPKDPEEEEKAAKLRRKFERGPRLFNSFGVINTRSPILARWDIYLLVMLLYVATVTPYEIGFIFEEFDGTSWPPILWWINRLVDFSFLVDMVVNFYLPFMDKQGNINMSKPAIRRNYLRGWFGIDLVSVLPYDSLRLVLSRSEGTNESDDAVAGDEQTKSLTSILRLVRLFRIIKLLRILRTSRIFKRWESRLEVNYQRANLMGLLLGLCFLSHWLACVWALLLKLEGDEHTADFCSVQDGYCPKPYPEETREEFRARVDEIWETAANRLYLQLLFWAWGLLLGNGYPIGYITDLQRAVLLIYLVAAGISNAFIIGNVVNVIDSTQEMNRDFYAAMDHLNAFIRNKNLMDPATTVILNGEPVDGPTLCSRAREYYIFAHEYKKRLENFTSIQHSGAKSISAAIATTLYGKAVKKVDFFKLAAEDLISELAEHVKQEMYCINDRVFTASSPADSLYIIATGSVFVHFRILTEGDSFGNRVFFASRPNALRGHTATCLSNSVLYRLMRPALIDAMKKFGDSFTSRAGTQISYLTIVRLNANIISFYAVIRRAAVVGIRHGFATGVQLLNTEYGEPQVMDTNSPVLSIYYSYVAALVKAATIRASAFSGEGEGDRRSTYSLDQLGGSDQAKLGNAAFMRHWTRQYEEYKLLCNNMSNNAHSLLYFLRSRHFKGLGLEAYYETFSDQNLSMKQVRELDAPAIAAATGMSLGKAMRICEAIKEDEINQAISRSEREAAEASKDVFKVVATEHVKELHFVGTILQDYAMKEEELEKVTQWRQAVIAAKRRLVAFFCQPRFQAMSFSRYAHVFERQHLDLDKLRRLGVAEIAMLGDMPTGDAFVLKDALEADAAAGKLTDEGEANAGLVQMSTEVAQILIAYSVNDKDKEKLRMWDVGAATAPDRDSALTYRIASDQDLKRRHSIGTAPLNSTLSVTNL